ncbi:MAG: caspase family protein, partial [bacterium]|nr:caspase family protein [bacterium]
AQKLGFVKKKGEYIPIPGDAFMLFYRDKKGKLTGVGHIGFVMRVEVKDDKAVAINTIEGNTSNRVKIGKRDLTRDEIVGFINTFPDNEQPTNWEKGLVRSSSVIENSTRSIRIRRKTMQKKALCVGISEFRDRQVSPLPGCVNDAVLLANTLKTHYGFTTAGTRLLTNENATKAGIITRLNWLVEGAGSGDVLVFTIASHGTWTVDRSGDEDPGSNLQGRDEMLVPYDYGKEQGLVDDEIGAILDKVPAGARLYCIIDTCHSGTATRALLNPFQAPSVLKNRFLRPSPDIMNRFNPDAGWRSRRTTQDDQMNRISISGCTDDEQSLDYPTSDGSHGLMSYSLYQALEAHNWQGTVTEIFNEVQQNVVKVAKTFRFQQTPQLHGPEELRNAQLFR